MISHDRAEIARVACANPGSMAAAVMARFGVTRDRASKLIHLARGAGFDIPRDSIIRSYDRAEVARIAKAFPRGMGRAVAEHFNISRTHANRLIDLARRDGFDIPRVQAAAAAQSFVAPRFSGVLVCSCGWSCAVLDGALALAAHTRREHDRRPTPLECTPQQSRKVAA